MTVFEAHIALLSGVLANMVGIAVGLRSLRAMNKKLNGHLRDHMNLAIRKETP